MLKVISFLMPRFGEDGMHVLNVAEKNDAAKCLSQIMSNGRSNRREGFSKFNKIYEFEYKIFNCNCNMIMTSVSGHLIDLDFGGGYNKWNQCAPVALFEAPICRFVPDNFKDIQKTLEREVRKCQALIIWTDGDREGENIGFEIIEVCQKAKSNIDVYRAKFSEITSRAVHQACRNLVAPDKNVSNAVEVRRELDLRIGASFTRFQTMRLQKRFPTVLADQLISYGSCQFPTLGFVVERYKQVQEFLSEEFYKIKVTHFKDECTANFVWKRGRLFHERVCSILCNMCQENPRATVTNMISKPKSKWRPVALDTVELEKLASRKLKINAKETMKIAEKLYTQGIISYPRTETNIFPKGLNLTPLVENQTVDPQWGGFASNILANNGPNPRQGKKTDNAHPPIHPIKYIDSLQGNEKRIYEFIVRHFLACVSKDAVGHETVFEIEISGEYFTVHGLVITERNYLDVYPYEQWNTKNIPIYQLGEVFFPDSIELVSGETCPPPLLTEADLITLMDKHGIGTDATHAEHIETIKSRNYVGVQHDGTFLPGQLGMALVEGYDAMGFAMSKPHLRASLEADLVLICQGLKNEKEVLTQQIQSYKNVFEQAVAQVQKLDDSLSKYFGEASDVTDDIFNEMSDPVRKCPKCGNNMTLRKTKEGSFFLGCMGYPNCRNSLFFPKFLLNAVRSDTTCLHCKPHPVHKIEFHFKRGSMPPGFGEHYIGCIGGCDEMLIGALAARDAIAPVNNPPPLRRADLGHGAFNNSGGIQMRDNQCQFNNNQQKTNYKQTSNQNQHGTKKQSFSTTNIQKNNKFSSTTTKHKQNNLVNKNHKGFNNNQGDDSNVVCNCNQSAIKLVVKKEGPNQGRQFFKCGQSDRPCNFFLWSEEQGNKSLQNVNKPISNTNNDTKCGCELPAAQRTVQKDGPNKGRQFYCCPNSRGEQCSFFQWVDQALETNEPEQGGSSNISKRKAPGGLPQEQTKKRKCGVCAREGHTKRSCPFAK
nr:DNA topoisomerase 3-alpha isoform X2 [Hydra vulgaris]